MTEFQIPIPTTKLSFDPHKYEDMYSMFLLTQIYTTLFRFDSMGAIRPELANKINFNPVEKAYVIEIKTDEKFSDGTKIESTHFVESFKRAFLLGASIVADMGYVKGYLDALKGNTDKLGIKAIDKHTIEIRVENETDLMVKHLALPDFGIQKLKSAKDLIAEPFVTSGSYVVEKHDDGEIILTLSKEKEEENVPQIIKIIKVAPSDLTNKLNNNNFDSLEFYSIDSKLEQDLIKKGWKNIVSAQTYEHFCLMNPRKVDRKLREFIVQILRSNEYLSILNQFHIRDKAKGIIPAFLPGGNIDVPMQKEAKIPKISTNKQPLKIVFNEINLMHKETANFICENLVRVSQPCIVEALKADKYYEILFGKRAEVILAGKGLDYPDGYANLAYFRTDIPANFLFMEDESMNTEIRNLVFLSKEARTEKYYEIQKKILNQFTAEPLYFGSPFSNLWSKRVNKVNGHPFGIHFMKLNELRLKNGIFLE